jgi:hypothetical protein
MPIGFVDSQDEPRVPLPVPDISIMESAVDDVSSVRDDRKVFDVSILLSGRVLIFVNALREIRPRTLHITLCAELEFICEQIRRSPSLISECHTKLLLPHYDDRLLRLISPAISAPRQISAFSLSGMVKLVLTGGPKCESEAPNNDGSERSDHNATSVQYLQELPERDRYKVLAGAIFCIGIFILAAYLAVNRDEK